MVDMSLLMSLGVDHGCGSPILVLATTMRRRLLGRFRMVIIYYYYVFHQYTIGNASVVSVM